MFTAADFRAIASGRRRGPLAAATRGLLAAAEWPYTAIVRRRNARFDRDPRRIQRVGVPVISVGNLTLGGTGKTPLVEWLARQFFDRGVRVGLISRGYKARSGRPNDEALELAEKLPGVPHLQDRDRVAAAGRLIREHGCELLLLDDAFQHRRIHRDLDIVLIDALQPFGFDRVFPRGLLREPLDGLRRAHVVALSRAETLAEAHIAAIHDRVREYAPDCLWLELAHQPRELLSRTAGAAGREPWPLHWLRGQPVLALCGIGNPLGFRLTLESCGAEIVEFLEFPDHHAFTPANLRDLTARVQSQPDIVAVVCTHKDLVKIDQAQIADRPLFALVIGMEVRRGLEDFQSRLDALLS